MSDALVRIMARRLAKEAFDQSSSFYKTLAAKRARQEAQDMAVDLLGEVRSFDFQNFVVPSQNTHPSLLKEAVCLLDDITGRFLVMMTLPSELQTRVRRLIERVRE